MRKSNELFLLIKSLSKSEKRYFKLHSALHSAAEKNNYLRLFEVIDKQVSYDEVQIKKQFKGEKFTDHLFATKSYLFNVILNSLVDYNLEKLTSYKLYEDIMKTKILVSKGLTKSALKLTGKAIELASAHSKYFIHGELLHIQWDILLGNIKLPRKILEKVNLERNNVLEELTSYINYSSLYGKLHSFFVITPVASSDDDIKKLSWLRQEKLFNDETMAKGFYARNDLLGIKTRYYWFIGDYDKSLDYRKKSIALLEEYLSIKEDEPYFYVLSIYSYLIYGWFSLSLSECEEYYKKLRNSAVKMLKEEKDEAVIKNVYTIYFITEILWLEKKNEEGKLLEKLETLEVQLKKFNTTLEPQKLLDIFSMAGGALFRMGHFENSLNLTNKVLNYEKSNLLESLYRINLIRVIVIHYELGNYDIMEYLFAKLNRIDRKHKQILLSEKKLLKGISALMNSVSKSESLYILEELKFSFEKLSATLTERIFIIRMGLINWVDRSIQKLK